MASPALQFYLHLANIVGVVPMSKSNANKALYVTIYGAKFLFCCVLGSIISPSITFIFPLGMERYYTEMLGEVSYEVMN